jgi:hypothetical protein
MDCDGFDSAMRDGKTIDEKDVISVADDFISQPCIIPSAAYDIRVLKACISSPEWLRKAKNDISGMQSLVARCIEWTLAEASELIISSLFSGLSPQPIYLRWIGSFNIYMCFRKYGFCDIEWEKSIVFLQRRWRARKLQIKSQDKLRFTQRNFIGPEIKEYECKKKYFGYRHALYWMRWNRTKRYQLYRDILLLMRDGDCAWQAYIDFLHEDGDELPRRDEWIEDMRTQRILKIVCSFDSSKTKTE